MSMIFGTPKAPAPPPPPQQPAQLTSPSIAEQGASERSRLAGAEGAGFDGTLKTSSQGAAAPSTTASPAGGKTLLGS